MGLKCRFSKFGKRPLQPYFPRREARIGTGSSQHNQVPVAARSGIHIVCVAAQLLPNGDVTLVLQL